MGSILIVVLVVGFCVFVISYLNIQKVIDKLYAYSFGSRDEILKMIDLMLLPISKKQLDFFVVGISFGLGMLIVLLLWPNWALGGVLGGIFVVLGWKVPKMFFSYLKTKRENMIANQMLDAGVIMENGIKAGLTPQQSMERVIKNMQGPLPQEFSLVLKKVQLGMPFDQALEEFATRIPAPDVKMFVNSIGILRATGGNLAETFSTIVSTIRGRQKVEKKIQALTAQGIMQGTILLAIPFVLLCLFAVISPDFIKPLFTTIPGALVLLVVLFLEIIGGVVIKKIVSIEV